MNIWLLQTGEPLPLNGNVRKMRTALLAEKLLERGHRVQWWANAFEHQRKIMVFDADCQHNLENGLILQIIRGCGYEKNMSFARYMDHRIVAGKFRERSRITDPPDVVVASMPCHHLAYEAVRYCNQRKIPVLIDVRDPWPDTFIDILPFPVLKAIGKIILYQDFHRLRLSLGYCSGILAMSQTMLEWALGKVGRTQGPWDRVFYMGYKKVSTTEDANLFPDWMRKTDRKRIAVYVGTFGRSYELDLILKSARRFIDSGRNDICFVLAGTGQQEKSLRSEANKLANAILPGWISANEIQLLLKRAYFGLVPCRSVEGALPNKVFEYFSAGLPVISSLQGEMADTIDRFQLGLNYAPGDLESLYRNMKLFLENSSLRESMSSNVSLYFRDYGDADQIYTNYANHIENLALGYNADQIF